MNIGIVGSRRRDETEDLILVAKALNTQLEKYKAHGITGFKIISGGCPQGGDKFAEMLAEEMAIEKQIFKADWRRYGRGAGFVRNTDIADTSDILIACVAEDRKGGTEDTIKKFCKKLGLTEEYCIIAGWLILV